MIVSPSETTTYTITAEGQGTTTASAEATATVVNIPPTAVDDSAATAEDTPVTVDVLANDSDADGNALAIAGATQGAHGLVTVNGDGTLTYTPGPNFNGTDNFTYSVTDGYGGSANAAVNITVTAVNDPPEAANDAKETDQSVPVTIAVLTNDVDPDGDALHIAGFTQPGAGTVTDEGNGVLKYSPNPSFNGIDTFTYTAEDPSGVSSTAWVTVTVVSPISLAITSPSDGELVKGPKVLVEGTVVHRSGLETGVTVNNLPAIVYAGRFVANEVPLEEGENTITVAATDTNGNSTSVSINVSADTSADCVGIRSIAYWGVLPFETTLIVTGAQQEPVLTDTGPGPVEYLSSTNEEEYPVKITTEGIYHITAEAPDGQGETCSNTLAVVILNKADLDALLRGKWNDMKSGLSTGAIEDALGYFREGSRENYRRIFTALADKLPSIVSGMQDIEMITVEAGRAQYRIRRGHVFEGEQVTLTYYITFVLDEDGMWRLDQF